jgi:hypothetical protein
MGEVAVLLFPATDGAGLVAMPREAIAHGPVGAWRYSLYLKCLLIFTSTLIFYLIKKLNYIIFNFL